MIVMDKEIYEACGVFGAIAKEPGINITEVIYHGLIGLQHRSDKYFFFTAY